MSASEHRARAPSSLRFCVLTVSDTRTLETDTGGALACELLAGEGHTVLERALVRDDVGEIQGAVRRMLATGCDAVIVTGGTGISPRDVTPEAVRPLLEKELDGFGEMFRHLSMKEIGTAAMMSRALAGISGGKAVFCIPGSRGGVRLALAEIILKEAGHVVWEAGK